MNKGFLRGAWVRSVMLCLAMVSAAIAKNVTVSATTLHLSTNAGCNLSSTGCGQNLSGTVSLANTGAAAVSFSAVSNQPWLTVSPSSGSVGANSSVTLTIRANPAGLEAGTYSGVIRISVPSGTLTVGVTLSMQGIALAVVPTALNLTAVVNG